MAKAVGKETEPPGKHGQQSESPQPVLLFPRARKKVLERVRSSLVLSTVFRLLCPGEAQPQEGTTGSCVDAFERGAMTWRFV